MYKAYVLVKVKPQKEDAILRALSRIHAVEEAHKLFGQFDLIVEIRRKGMREIMETVSRIRSIDGVEDTITNLVADFELDNVPL